MDPQNFDILDYLLPDWLYIAIGIAAILWIAWVLFQSMPRNGGRR
jgi:hypothetical protein